MPLHRGDALLLTLTNYGKTAVVEYVGKLEDGTVFDSTEGMDPLEFVIGSGAVINGFDEAIAEMSPGESTVSVKTSAS